MKFDRPDKDIQPYGVNATAGERWVFGTEVVSDVLDTNYNDNFLRGITKSFDPNGYPLSQWDNSNMFTATALVSYLFQMGVAEWSTNQPYYLNSKTTGSDGKLYTCQVGTSAIPNVGNDPVGDGGANWKDDSFYFVDKISNEDIAGRKTFSSNPISSAVQSTAVNALVRKDYVDSKISLDTGRFDKPTRRQPLFIKIDPSSIKIPTGLSLVIGTTLIVLSADYTLDLDVDLDTGTKTAGTDYYVYAKTDSTFYISANSTITADRLIGGFHYGLTTETEVISGNKTELDMVKLRGINSYTFWDLKYLSNAKAGNKGSFCNGIKWYDIYLNDVEYGINGYSRPFAQIAGGGTEYGRGYPKIPLEFGGNGTVTYGKLTPFQAYDLAISSKKDLISYKEFTDIAYGVQEGLSQAEPVLGQNGHVPALTSRYGMELATGNQYIWSSEIGSSTATEWSLITDSRGQVYTNAYIALLGGNRVHAAGLSGSRCSFWGSTLTYSIGAVGSRCCSDLLILD